MNAEQIRAALRKRYNDTRRYAIAEEVGLTTGFSHRRLDMMVLDCYFSNGFRIDGFEIKVSTADLRRELEDPEKHVAFFNVIDYYTMSWMCEIIDITPYLRTCDNCIFYKHDPDRACGHPGGWTAKTKNMYSIECNEFVNKNKALPGSIGQGKGYGSRSN